MDNKTFSLRFRPVNLRLEPINSKGKNNIRTPTTVTIPEAPGMSILIPSNKPSAQDLARSTLLKFKNALIDQKKNTPVYVNIDPINQLPPSRAVPRFNRPPVIQPSPQAINTTPIARPAPRPVPVFNSQPIMQPKNQANSFSRPPISQNPFESAPRIQPTVSVRRHRTGNTVFTETTFRR